MSIVRYAGVGAIATTAHYAVLGLLVEAAGTPAGPAAFLGAIVGAWVAYLGNRCLTFNTSDATHSQAMPRFALVALIGGVANGLIVGAGVWLGFHYFAAQVVATLAVMALTYHANRLWTFS